MRALLAPVIAVAMLFAPASPANGASAEGAIQWAESQIGSQSWNGLCLRFVRVAFLGRTSASDAYQFFVNLGRPNRGAPPNSVPRGALAFFGPTIGNPYGHVGISLGGGQMINAVAWGKLAGVRVTPITFAKNFVGWAYPPADWSGRETAAPIAIAPAPTPAPTPQPTPIPTPVPTPSLVTVSGVVTQGGRPVGLAINVFRSGPDFCQKWFAGAFSGPAGVNAPEHLPIINNVFVDGSYSIRIPPGTYQVVLSLRAAPGGNWFWNMTRDCTRAVPVTFTADTVQNFAFPGQ